MFAYARAATWSLQEASSCRITPQRGLRMLKGLHLGDGVVQSHIHGDDHSDEDDKQDEENQGFFMGGEKSDLAIHLRMKAWKPTPVIHSHYSAHNY